MRGTALLLAAAAAASCIHVASAGEATHSYDAGEPVTVWLSKVGPYHNPQEVYSFYSLPFCSPETKLEPESRIGGLGEILEGNELQNSDLPVSFGKDVDHAPICKMTLDDAAAQLLAYAVSNHYWYQLFVDELPVWGMVGEILAEEDVIAELESHTERPHGIADLTYLYTHKNFTIAYAPASEATGGKGQIIEVTMTSEGAVQIEPGRSYEMSYSVHWVPSDRVFERRFDRYLDGNFFEHQIHWFSLFNSFMMVVFLCGLVALILMRTLRADYARYMREEEDGFPSLPAGGDAEAGEGGTGAAGTLAVGAADDSGWKQVHGDVFRRPHSVRLYSALMGTGVQLLALSLVVILAAFAGSLYVDRGAVTKAAIIAYGLTAAVSGFVSGRWYRQFFLPEEAPNWISVMLMTAGLFPAALFGALLTLNAVASLYGIHNTLSLLTVLKLAILWACIALPLNVAGTIVGRRFASAPKVPTRVNPYPRPIPPKPWYASPAAVCVLAGLLPFGSIFIETYFVFTSFWNYKFYYVYGFMLAVLCILAVVVACVSVVATYLLLNAEDHRWHWHAFLSGASPALYVFLYSIYYFLFRTEMSGFLQTLFYFGYTALGCGALGLMTGTIGALAATAFVRAIFSGIKID